MLCQNLSPQDYGERVQLVYAVSEPISREGVQPSYVVSEPTSWAGLQYVYVVSESTSIGL